jgi:hypothetical protein
MYVKIEGKYMFLFLFLFRDICSQIMGMLKPSSQKHMNGSQKMLNAPVQLGKES